MGQLWALDGGGCTASAVHLVLHTLNNHLEIHTHLDLQLDQRQACTHTHTARSLHMQRSPYPNISIKRVHFNAYLLSTYDLTSQFESCFCVSCSLCIKYAYSPYKYTDTVNGTQRDSREDVIHRPASRLSNSHKSLTLKRQPCHTRAWTVAAGFEPWMG